MTDRRPIWAATVMIALASLALTACGGNLPVPDSFGVVDAEASELEFTAPLEGMGPDSWSIGGLAVVVSDSTQLDGEPQVGDLVRVQALLQQSGLTALSITSVTPAAPDQQQGISDSSVDEVEFTGPVVAIGPDSWTVGDQTLAVTSDTEIKDAIVVGEVVKVHASVNPDQSLTGTEIELAGADDGVETDEGEDEQDLEFKGIVESISAEAWTVSGLAFLVTPDTEIKDTIAVGDFVEIHAILSVDGALTALRIELADGEGQTGEELDDQDDLDDDESGEELSDDDDESDDDGATEDQEDADNDQTDDDVEDGGGSSGSD